MKSNPEKRLDVVVREFVESQLTQGNSVRLSAKDLVVTLKEYGYAIPKHLESDNPVTVSNYCGSILYNLNPNHGTVKREEMGPGFTYLFVPDIPRRQVQ
jgi:hypothetical protein